MAVYNLLEVRERITQMIHDGYAYAGIAEIPCEGECPPGLSFLALAPEEGHMVDYGKIDSLPPGRGISS